MTDLEPLRQSYLDIARVSDEHAGYLAARVAAKSIATLQHRADNPQTYQQRHNAERYVSKRLIDIVIRYNEKIARETVVPTNNKPKLDSLKTATRLLRNLGAAGDSDARALAVRSQRLIKSIENGGISEPFEEELTDIIKSLQQMGAQQ